MDSARRTTDLQISAMRREFAADYDQLGGSMSAHLAEYLSDHVDEEGRVMESAFHGRGWSDTCGRLADEVYGTNRAAMAETGRAVDDVRRLTSEGSPSVSPVPHPSIDRRADLAWNRSKIEAAARGGIGRTPAEAGERMRIVADMNSNACARRVRTAINGAENAGRMDAMIARGGSKRWVTVQDERVRDSHAELHGMVVPVEEEFPNGLMFPGDPSGPPEEVYNCRCSLEWVDEESSDEVLEDEIIYGEFRDLSYVDDDLGAHWGDGSDLDPMRMIMEDTGFDAERTEQVRRDVSSWVGTGYTRIRAEEDAYAQTAERLEEFISASPKYEGTVYRGIGVERETADEILATLRGGGSIDNHGIASWATESDWATTFAEMGGEDKSDPVSIVLQLDENRSGTSIKHIADIDNDEVIAPKGVRYELSGSIETVVDPYEGEYVLVHVREVS